MTAIEWTHIPGYKPWTWNPTTGCDRVSPGCAHCYALTLAKRLKAMGQPRYQRDGDPATSGPGFGLSTWDDRLDEPSHWEKPRAVFVNSMSDLFHEEIPDAFIAGVFEAMRSAPAHIFMILTKRPERARAWFDQNWPEPDGGPVYEWAPPLPNVWLGVSIENARYTWRADVLRELPAAIRFISAEPLLGSLFEVARAHPQGVARSAAADAGCDGPSEPRKKPLDLTGIDWLIAGGESGPKHRPLNIEHARELRDACAATPGTAFFFKQVGGRTPKSGGALLDGREHRAFPAQIGAAA